MTDAKTTVDLLDELEGLGFNNDAFSALHHFKERGRPDTIAEHRAHCLEKKELDDDGLDARIQRRLQLVLAAYKHGGFRSGRPEVFRCLAEAAYNEVTSKHHA